VNLILAGAADTIRPGSDVFVGLRISENNTFGRDFGQPQARAGTATFVALQHESTRAPPKSTRVLFSPDNAAHLLDSIGQAYLLFFDQPAIWS
jgi:hypothetical protein